MRILNLMAGLLLVLLFGIFFYFIYDQAINIPYIDDFAFFDYTLRMIDAASFSEFRQVLWAEHGGHRIVLTKLSFLLQYLLTGEIDFRQKILFETFFIWSFFGFFLFVFHKNSIPLFYVLPVGLILFSPIYYMNIFWNMTIWQHAGSTLLLVLCLYFLCSNHRYSFFIAMMLAIAVTLNNGNGWLSVFIGGWLLMIQKRRSRLLPWLLFCGVLSVTHLLGNTPAPHQELSLRYVFQTICVFTGSVFFFLRGRDTDNFYGGLGLLATAVILVLIPISVRWRQWTNSKFFVSISDKIINNAVNSAILGGVGSMILTAVGAGVLRQSREFVVWPHYMLYSVFTVLFVYTLVIISLPNRYRLIVGAAGVGFSALTAIGGVLFALPQAMVYKQQLLADAFKLKYVKMDSKPLLYNNPVTMGQLRYPEAVKRGMYHLPSTPMDELTPSVFDVQADSSLFSDTQWFEIEKEAATGRTIKLLNKNLLAAGKEPVYVVLKNKEETYLIAPKPILSGNRKMLFRRGEIFLPGFSVDLFRTNYTSGDYQLGIILLTQQGPRVVYTRQQITIKNPAVE